MAKLLTDCKSYRHEIEWSDCSTLFSSGVEVYIYSMMIFFTKKSHSGDNRKQPTTHPKSKRSRKAAHSFL